jgi:hypothetical protein
MVTVRFGNGDQSEIMQTSVIIRATNEIDARDCVIRWLDEDVRKLLGYGRVSIDLAPLPKSEGADKLRVGEVYGCRIQRGQQLG